MDTIVKKTVRKAVAMVIALVMAIAFMPAFTQDAHAGDGTTISEYVIGLNSDGKTIDPGKTLKISLDDLEKQVSGIKDVYKNKEATISWMKGKMKDDGYGSYLDATEAKTYVKDGYVCTDITMNDCGLLYRLDTDSLVGDTSFNTNSEVVCKVYDKVTVVDAPVFATDLPSISAKNPLKMNFSFQLSGRFTYYWSDPYRTHTINKKILRLYKNGKKIAEKASSGNVITFKNVAVSYNKYDNFKAQLFAKIGGATIEGPFESFKARSVKVGKNTVYATKLSKNKAIVRWSGAAYANKYRIYKGSKLIKTVKKSSRKYVVKKKGAGKAKYRVIPIYKSGKKVCKGTSTKAKPKKNQVTYNRSTYYGSASYATCPFVVTKISLKGRTYTVTGYALNNRIFNMTKYSRLSVKLTVGGRKAFSKTYKNKYVGAKNESSKKIVLKIKGKAGVDLVHGGFCSLSVSEKPYWTWAGRHIK